MTQRIVSVRGVKLHIDKWGRLRGRLTFDTYTGVPEIPVLDVPQEIRTGLLRWLTSGGEPE